MTQFRPVYSLIYLVLLTGMIIFPGAPSEASNQIKNAASRIDRAVEQGLKRKSIRPNPVIASDTFLRRIYLDAIGRIPSLSEINRFTQSDGNRDQLIKELVNQTAYQSHQFNYWTSVLRIKPSKRPDHTNYLNFVRDSLRENRSYRDFVYEMLSAEGSPYELGNGAAFYFLRDAGMPLDNLSMTTQVFLGLNLSCAQCHDDPFTEWTQMDFYQLYGYTNGISHLGMNNKKAVSSIGEKMKRHNIQKEKHNVLHSMMLVRKYEVKGSGKGFSVLPYDYKYDDGKPLAYVPARVLYGKQPKVHVDLKSLKPAIRTARGVYRFPGKNINARKQFARWLTASENDMFVKTIVNRMWHKTMGATLVGPLTNMDTQDMGPNPELTGVLMAIMREIDFDLKTFEQIIFSTSTYQRAMTSQDIEGTDQYLFQGPVLRRLSHSQLWDSLAVLQDEKLDERPMMKSRISDTIRIFNQIMHWEEKDYVDFFRRMPDLKGGKRDIHRQVLKSLSSYGKMASENARSNAKMHVSAAPQKQSKKKKRKQGQLAKKTQPAPTALTRYQPANKSVDLKHYQTSVAQKRRKGSLKRTSEIEAPAKPSHFLRQFGQSDRLMVDSDSLESSVPQILHMMNGISEMIADNDKSSLVRNINTASSQQNKLKRAYLMILCREPTSEEVSLFESKLKIKGYAWRDVLWTLLNTNEFKFKQ